MSIVTLEEAKRQLMIPLTDESADTELQAYVDAITGVVEDYKREVIEPRQITEDVLDCRSGRTFRLWSVPVISLTSVQSLDGARTWDVSAMRVRDSGLVHVLSGPALHGPVEVTYQAGFETVPEKYKQGALVTLQHIWETQRGVGGVRSGVIGPEETYDPRYSYSIPRKALEWLGAPRPVVG